MNVLWITIPISLALAGFFVVAFLRAARHDQFEDLVTPAHRMLIDDDTVPPAGFNDGKDGTDGEKPTAGYP